VEVRRYSLTLPFVTQSHIHLLPSFSDEMKLWAMQIKNSFRSRYAS
jgi:hypothetical protein